MCVCVGVGVCLSVYRFVCLCLSEYVHVYMGLSIYVWLYVYLCAYEMHVCVPTCGDQRSTSSEAIHLDF